MVSKRIIPCLDVDNGRVVKGTNFVDIKDAGDPVELAKKYAKEGADELVFLDITASSDKRIILKDIVQKVAKEIFIPFTVGGGINSIDMIQDILNLGADKISLNTAAFNQPTLINEAAKHFGSQCIVVAVDIKRRTSDSPVIKQNTQLNRELWSDKHTEYDVYSHGGRHNIGIDAIKWIQHCEPEGAGELLITSMDRDGTNKGYDIECLKQMKSLVTIPIIASGGAGNPNDIKNALHTADAALLASILHYNKFTINDIKDHCKTNNITIR